MTQTPVRIPSAAEAETALGIPVAGRPIEASLAAANRAAYGETDPSDLVLLAARAAAGRIDEGSVPEAVATLVARGAPASPFGARHPAVIRRLRDDDYVLP